MEVVEDGIEEAWHVLEAEEDDCLVIEEENAESVERPRRVDQLPTDTKITDLYFTTRVHQHVGGLNICQTTISCVELEQDNPNPPL